MNQSLSVFLNAIADDTRRKIIICLRNDSCVGDLWSELELPQNLVSHHLKVLKEAGLVQSRKQGLKVVYRLNKVKIERQLEKLTKVLI